MVATAAGGTPAIISDGVTGLLVPVGDTAGVARGGRVLSPADPHAGSGLPARDHVALAFGRERSFGERRRLREMQERVGLTTTTGMEGAS